VEETAIRPRNSAAPIPAAETRIEPRRRPIPGWAWWALPATAAAAVAGYLVFQGAVPDRAAAEAANEAGWAVLDPITRAARTLTAADRESLRVARTYFEDAIDEDSRYKFAWNNLGDVQRRLGQHTEAVASFRRAVDIDPGYAAAWVNMADVYDRMGRNDDAAGAYALAQQANLPALNAIRRASSPAAAAAESLRTNPTLVLAPNNFAFFLIRTGKPDGALRVLEPTLELYPGIGALWKNYGLALSGMGRYAEADSAFARALEAIPGYPAAEAGQALVLEKRGARHEALARWRALEQSPDTAVAAEAREAVARLGG
jgi:tetratricopeptide (TPR) repeat protein